MAGVERKAYKEIGRHLGVTDTCVILVVVGISQIHIYIHTHISMYVYLYNCTL